MKTDLIRHLALSIIIFLIFSSCKKQEINEIKVADLPTLASQFKEPPREYTTAPFFVWNAKITKEEIEMDLESFKNAGSSQVFIHPRPGLITEYLSDEWFDLFRYTIEKGKELGMDIWMYDENSYPSGFAGGHVPDVMPESYNQGQGLRMKSFDILPDTCDKYFMCLKEENGAYIDITKNLENEKGKSGRFFLFSKAYNQKSDWYGGFSYVDLLYPGVTQKFIEVTMSGYEKNLSAEFGKTLPGTFTDEPQINSPGGIRWTPDLFEMFQKQWKYDLKTCLPSLFEEVGDWKKVRHNYTQTLLQLFIDRWAKPWYAYCEEKGLKFTGHYWEHEWPNMRQGGDNMAMYAWHHIPSIDMLFNQWNDVSPRAQFGNVRSVKELASAANQTGRQRKLSETYGGSGWELTFADMKRNGDWEYALGVNLMNQHLTYFTMAGARKYDYPPTFDYHEPWWNNYKYLNDHYARLSLALSAGKQTNDILILEPTTTAWLYDSYAKRNEKLNKIGQSFQTFISELEKKQVEYDLGSENIIRDLGDIKKGKLIVGQATYSRVVIPPMTENLDKATFKILSGFVRNGGTLIAFSEPELVDGSPNQELKEFFQRESLRIIKPGDLPGDVIVSEYLNSVNISFKNNGDGDLYHNRRELSDGQVLFLTNSSLTGTVNGEVATTGSGALEMNTFTGEISGFPYNIVDGKTVIKYSLPPAGSLLIFIPAAEQNAYKTKELPKKMIPVETGSPLTVAQNVSNAFMIDFCDVEVGNENIKDIHTFYAADKVFKYYGFRNGNPWNTSVQFRKNIVERDTFGGNSGFTATYHFRVRDKFDMSELKAVIERPPLWKISVNGKEVNPENGKWWLDRQFGVVNIGSLINQGDNIITLKSSPMKIHAEIEPVYLTGNFSVVPAKKGWEISAPAKKLQIGSWKSQGLPFYSWGMTYSREFNADQSKGWEVALGKWNGTVAEVTVNGQKAAVIAFPPYRADVSGFIKPGINRIDVTVTGSLKNLLGPHHNNPAPGLTSPGSWRNVKSYPAGADYQMIDYGLFEDFIIYKSI